MSSRHEIWQPPPLSRALIAFGWWLLVLAGLAILGGVMGAIWVTVSGAGSGGVPVGQAPVLAGIALLYGFMGAIWFGVVAAVVGALGVIIGRLDEAAKKAG